MRPGPRVVRTVAGLAVVVGASAVLARTGMEFGELPECGTGSYFLYPLQPLGGLIIFGFLVTAVAVAALIALGLRPIGCLAAMLLVGIEAASAAAGSLWSDAVHGCIAFRDHGYAQESVWLVIIAGLAGGAIAVGTASLMRWLSRPRHPQPTWGPHVARAGLFRVRAAGKDSGVAGLRPGDLVWVGASEDVVLLEAVDSGDAPPLRWIEDRIGLVADAYRTTTSLWRDGRRIIELDPEAGVDPAGILAALERSAAPGPVSRAARPG